MDFNDARRELDHFAENFGGTWLIAPVNCGSTARTASGDGRASDIVIGRPSASSVSVSMPQRTVNR
jgi:hypothetical protein